MMTTVVLLTSQGSRSQEICESANLTCKETRESLKPRSGKLLLLPAAKPFSVSCNWSRTYYTVWLAAVVKVGVAASS